MSMIVASGSIVAAIQVRQNRRSLYFKDHKPSIDCLAKLTMFRFMAK